MNLRTCLSGDRPLAIPALTFPEALKILVLAPHPDDFDAIDVTLDVNRAIARELTLSHPYAEAFEVAFHAMPEK